VYSFGDYHYIKALKTDYGLDVVCQHGRYKRKAIKEMIGENATFFTILRDPIKQFDSMWYFYDMHKRYNATLEQWLEK